RFLSVLGRGGHHDGDVTDLEITDPMDGGHLHHGAPPGAGSLTQDLLHDVAQLRLDRGVRCIAQLGHTPAVVVIAYGPDEHGGAAHAGVVHRGEDLVHGQRRVAYGCKCDLFHGLTVSIPAHESRSATLAFTQMADGRSGTDCCRGGTRCTGGGDVALLATHVPADDGLAAAGIQQGEQGFLVAVARFPSGVPQGRAVHHARVDQECEFSLGGRGDSCLVEAAYGAEGQIGGDLEVLHVGQFLDLVLGEGALTAHGHHTVGTTYVVQGTKGQGVDQVVHVAELPVLLVSLDGQQARCGEVAVDQGVQFRTDQRRRTYH